MQVLSSIVTEGVKCLWDPLKRSACYLIRYEKNIEDLRKEVEHMKRRRNDTQKRVDEAKRQLEEPTHEVQGWLKDANEAEADVNKIESEAEQSKRCLNGWCPNWTLRYRLSKQAVVKAAHVKEIYEKGVFSRVSCKPPSPSVELKHTDYVDSFLSTELVLKEVTEALKDESIRVIGVYGMGGVGKTTLMKRLNNELGKTNLFDKVIMTTVSRDVNFMRIQDGIAARLDLKLEHVTEDGATNSLRERLKNEKTVLIILDDIWSGIELSKLGIPSKSEHKGCKIIVTTRKESVCAQMDSDRKIKLEVLSKEDSWILFRTIAREKADKFRSIAEKIAESCGGLPLAITAIASCLKLETNEIVWMDALSALKNPTTYEVEDIMPEVINSLRFSYDHLKVEALKLFFLLCCLFPEDQAINVSTLIHYGIGESFLKMDGSLEDATKRGNAFIDKLKDSSLLLEYETGEVMLHDIVRDVGLIIASKEHGFFVRAGVGLNGWPEEDLRGHKRISLMNNRIKTFKNQPKCPQLLTLLLSGNQFFGMSSHFFEEMTALVVLDFSGTFIRRLPLSISRLKNLRTLSLDGCNLLKDISIVRELVKLEILKLRRTAIEELPEGLTEGLCKLKHLDLQNTSSLKRIAPKVISSLSSLEELNMEESFAKWEVGGNGDGSNADFSEVASLTRLTLLRVCVDDKSCQSQSYLGSLRNLKIFHIELGQIKGCSWYTYESRILWLTSFPVSEWVKFLVTITEALDISECEDFTDFLQLYPGGLDESFSGIIEGSSSRGQVRDDPRRVVQISEAQEKVVLVANTLVPPAFDKLRRLAIRDCQNLNYVFPSRIVQQLTKLEVLEIIRCQELEEIICMDNENNQTMVDKDTLPSLKRLALVELPILKNIYKRRLTFDWPLLEEISVFYCPNLKRLPLGPHSAPNLSFSTAKGWFDELELVNEDWFISRFSPSQGRVEFF